MESVTTEFKKNAGGCCTLFGTCIGCLIFGYIVRQVTWSITRNDVVADAVGGWTWLVSFPIVLCYVIVVFVPSLGSTRKCPEMLMSTWLAGVTWLMGDYAQLPSNVILATAVLAGLIGVCIGYDYRRRLIAASCTQSEGR